MHAKWSELSWTFVCCGWNIQRELGQYYGCWFPGSLGHIAMLPSVHSALIILHVPFRKLVNFWLRWCPNAYLLTDSVIAKAGTKIGNWKWNLNQNSIHWFRNLIPMGLPFFLFKFSLMKLPFAEAATMQDKQALVFYHKSSELFYHLIVRKW